MRVGPDRLGNAQRALEQATALLASLHREEPASIRDRGSTTRLGELARIWRVVDPSSAEAAVKAIIAECRVVAETTRDPRRYRASTAAAFYVAGQVRTLLQDQIGTLMAEWPRPLDTTGERIYRAYTDDFRRDERAAFVRSDPTDALRQLEQLETGGIDFPLRALLVSQLVKAEASETAGMLVERTLEQANQMPLDRDLLDGMQRLLESIATSGADHFERAFELHLRLAIAYERAGGRATPYSRHKFFADDTGRIVLSVSEIEITIALRRAPRDKFMWVLERMPALGAKIDARGGVDAYLNYRHPQPATAAPSLVRVSQGEPNSSLTRWRASSEALPGRCERSELPELLIDQSLVNLKQLVSQLDQPNFWKAGEATHRFLQATLSCLGRHPARVESYAADVVTELRGPFPDPGIITERGTLTQVRERDARRLEDLIVQGRALSDFESLYDLIPRLGSPDRQLETWVKAAQILVDGRFAVR